MFLAGTSSGFGSGRTGSSRGPLSGLGDLLCEIRHFLGRYGTVFRLKGDLGGNAREPFGQLGGALGVLPGGEDILLGWP